MKVKHSSSSTATKKTLYSIMFLLALWDISLRPPKVLLRRFWARQLRNFHITVQVNSYTIIWIME